MEAEVEAEVEAGIIHPSADGVSTSDGAEDGSSAPPATGAEETDLYPAKPAKGGASKGRSEPEGLLELSNSIMMELEELTGV